MKDNVRQVLTNNFILSQDLKCFASAKRVDECVIVFTLESSRFYTESRVRVDQSMENLVSRYALHSVIKI